MNLLEVKNLSLSFRSNHGETQVLKDISFTLKRSETLGIVGESGSGKSLTALSIVKLLPKNALINSGNIFYRDEEEIDLLQLSEKKIAMFRGNKIAMIFQEPMTSLNPTLKCGYQVLETLTNHLNISVEKAKEKVIEVFKEVKLPNPERVFNSYPHEISGGQKQRVMIAMAIALNPSILIADEPTTALDVTVQKSVLELLREIQQKYQMSIIFISHDLGVVSQIADRMLVMYQGKIVETGSAKQVLKNPQDRYTKGLLNCRPELSANKNRLPVLSQFISDENELVDSVEKQKNIHIEYKNEILKVNDLGKTFYFERNFLGKPKQTHHAVSSLSFSVFKGETLGLVGESGCGKTTLGRMIAQLIEKTSGSIVYQGKQLNKLSRKELKAFRKSMQIIFQDPYSSLNPKLSIGNALEEPLKVHGFATSKQERKKRVFDMLKKVKLEADSYHKYPHEFSGGQRQRIVIARALMLNPEFIICDESVSALDVSVQAEILNLLNDLKDEFDLTYIFISHDLSVVRYMSDRIMVMKDGKLVEINEADELYKSPASYYTKNLIDSIPKID